MRPQNTAPVRLRRLEAGVYESLDGRFSVERLDWDTEDRDDPMGATEWFLYDEHGNMIDGYPTLREARQVIARRSA